MRGHMCPGPYLPPHHALLARQYPARDLVGDLFLRDRRQGAKTAQRRHHCPPFARPTCVNSTRFTNAVSPHPTKDRRRSCARNCRRSPATVRGSALELALAGVAAHLASVVHRSTRIVLGAPKSCRQILARLDASQG